MLETKKLNLKFETYLLKDKKFWYFFVGQAILWFVFYFWQAREVVDLTLVKGNLSATITTHILNAIVLGILFFSCQILSVLLLPRLKFFWVILILMSCYLRTIGLSFVIAWWAIRMFGVKKLWQKFVIGFLALAGFAILMVPIQFFIMFIYKIIIEQTTVPI